MKTAILVIDVQRKLFDEEPRPYEADEVIQRINHITQQARVSGVPVIFIQFEHASFLEYGSDSWALQSGLTVNESDMMLRKTALNCFQDTGLQEKLNSMGVTELIICGYASEFCIDTTIRSAAQLGYTIQLVADAHTTHDKKHLSAQKIREHHNLTLSMGSMVTAVQSTDIKWTDGN